MADSDIVIRKGHEEYIKSGRWKCPKSPTGAHHWIEGNHTDLPGVYYCKWCFEVKEMPSNLDDAINASGRKGTGTKP